MLELRFHGRGGQGAVTSAELLAIAAIEEGRFAQAFPSFGPERRGAPVVAFARISDHKIRNRTAVTRPNAVLVLDPSLLRIVDVTAGLTDGGTVIINTSLPAEKLRSEFKIKSRLALVDANQIAREEIGRVITNTAMLGSLLKATGIVEMEPLLEAVRKRFGRIAERNINALKRSFETTTIEEVQA